MNKLVAIFVFSILIVACAPTPPATQRALDLPVDP